MNFKRLTIIVGAYGSGKTEVALNLAYQLAAESGPVGMVDLDIVNPFFRSRDQQAILAERGIQMISSNEGLETADLPALSPKIMSLFQNKAMNGIFDVGGDPAGARALGRFNRFFAEEDYDLWMVVNPFRPDTRDADHIAMMRDSLEQTSRLHVTGLIDNTNMGVETTAEDREAGRRLINAAANKLDLPIICRTCSVDCPIDSGEDGIPILALTLFIRPSWLAER